MKSKTSFINKTMLQKNVKLYWPIWTLYTIVLLLNGPFSMWSRFKSAEFIYGTNWHKYMLDIMSPAISMEADMIYDQMSLKEYIDPFTGEPVKGSRK